MLILRRKEGSWVHVTDRAGNTLRIRVCNIRGAYPGQCELAFLDDEHNFTIQRPERKPTSGTGPAAPDDTEP